MNDLKGELGNIHLNIHEARGFDILDSPFYIATSFNGRIIDTDLMQPQSNVHCNTEIIWETDKKQVRNARSCYMSIRLDCFTTYDRFVGMALVNLRSAKVIAESSVDQNPISQWIKLLKVPREWSKNSLLLQVSLTIRDNPIQIAKCRPETHLTGTMDVPVKFHENGDLQIGSDDEPLEKFQMKLAALEANNLDLLLQESMVFTEGVQEYFLVCHAFGMHIKLQRFSSITYESVTLNTMVVIDLMTTFELLSSYFEKYPIVKLVFLSKDHVFGVSGIDMSTLTTKVEPATFFGCMKGVITLEEEIVFKVTSPNPSPELTTRYPTLRMNCSLEVLEKVTKVEEEPDVNTSLGDDDQIEVMPSNQLEKLDKSSSSLMSEDTNHIYYNDPCQLFCLDVIIEAITWNELPTYDRMVVHFLHPQADNRVKVLVDVEETENRYMLIDNVNCKMFYQTTRPRIAEVVSLYEQQIEVRHAVTEELLACPIVIKSPKLSLENTEYTCLMPMMAFNGNQIAQLTICLHLEEGILSHQPRYHDLRPLIADPVLIHSLDDNYQCLRSEQVEAINQQGLPAGDVSHIDGEAKDKCNEPTDGMMDNTNTNTSEVQENASCSSPEDDIRELASDINVVLHKNTLKYAYADHNELVHKVSELEQRCDFQANLINKQHLELKELMKTHLTSEQSKTLLQDLLTMQKKCEECISAKKYFQHAFEKTAKEVHTLEMERQKYITSQIANDKESLKKLTDKTTSCKKWELRSSDGDDDYDDVHNIDENILPEFAGEYLSDEDKPGQEMWTNGLWPLDN